MVKPVRGWLLASIFLVLATSSSLSQDFNSAVAQFASKLASRTAPETASLTVRNQSSLGESTVSSIRAELERQLQTRGWKLTKAGESEGSISVTLGQNIGSYVWTAEITSATARQSVLFELPRPKKDTDALGGLVALSRTLLISSDSPLLDVALLENKIAEGAHLLALTPTSVQVYLFQASQWHLLQTQPLGSDPMSSRDLRGRIVPDQGSSFDAYLPGLRCTGVVTGTATVTCRVSDDPWPLNDERRMLGFYAANRNYFNGVISGAGSEGENVGPFYSAAILSDRAIYAGADGRIRAFSTGHRTPSTIAAQWGSSISGIQSSCQTDLILITAAGDFYANDAITAFQAANSDFRTASEAISFSGAVLSLKTSSDRQQAMAVVASLSGRYEAYLLTARCGA